MVSVEIHSKIIDQIKEDGLKKNLGCAFDLKCFCGFFFFLYVLLNPT